MKKKKGLPFSTIIMISILIFLIAVLIFPRWISVFYPQPHQDLIFAMAKEYEVDPYLVFAVIRAESKYQSNARSPVGARGLMQIMPETSFWIAENLGIENFDIEELHQPEVNIRFGCWYLANLNKQFEANLPVVIAAYNAGRGNVREWLIEEQWDGSVEQLDDVPFPETKKYIKAVLINYEAYKAIYTNKSE